jgi:hypothetical protein
MVVASGIAPETSCMSGRRSDWLSYATREWSGWQGLHLRPLGPQPSALLLSYTPKGWLRIQVTLLGLPGQSRPRCCYANPQ